MGDVAQESRIMYAAKFRPFARRVKKMSRGLDPSEE
jgi:hypothetical protein